MLRYLKQEKKWIANCIFSHPYISCISSLYRPEHVQIGKMMSKVTKQINNNNNNKPTPIYYYINNSKNILGSLTLPSPPPMERIGSLLDLS